MNQKGVAADPGEEKVDITFCHPFYSLSLVSRLLYKQSEMKEGPCCFTKRKIVVPGALVQALG